MGVAVVICVVAVVGETMLGPLRRAGGDRMAERDHRLLSLDYVDDPAVADLQELDDVQTEPGPGELNGASDFATRTRLTEMFPPTSVAPAGLDAAVSNPAALAGSQTVQMQAQAQQFPPQPTPPGQVALQGGGSSSPSASPIAGATPPPPSSPGLPAPTIQPPPPPAPAPEPESWVLMLLGIGVVGARLRRRRSLSRRERRPEPDPAR